jgi:hypothetical protein
MIGSYLMGVQPVAHCDYHKLHMQHKNYAIIQAVRCITYYNFYTWGPRTGPQQVLWPFAKIDWISMPYLGLADFILTYSECIYVKPVLILSLRAILRLFPL